MVTFQSTHPRRVWQTFIIINSNCKMFQSTHPRRVWLLVLLLLLLAISFNPHTHEGCDQPIQIRTLNLSLFQSTHPRRVWRANHFSQKLSWYVSIHTPTKGVTARFGARGAQAVVSIHTPTKGVTPHQLRRRLKHLVSIHTPTKGVTINCYVRVTSFFVSIHTPTKGVTDRYNGAFCFGLFQSTHPRRVWLINLRININHRSFNPHTHEGCDPLCRFWRCKQRVFQSTHPRRVWRSLENGNCPEGEFQSTHPRRVWLAPLALDAAPMLFQSTHPRRVWPMILDNLGISAAVSIHTPTKGVTLLSIYITCQLRFQSTHPRRVWLHIQQIAEYHDAKIIILRKMAK